MMRPKIKLAHNLLLSGVLATSLFAVDAAQAADGGRKFVPLGNASVSGLRANSAKSGNFIPLRNVSRRETKVTMMPLNGGQAERVWKLNDLRDTPRRSKAEEVPADVKLAMATAQLPEVPNNQGELPETNTMDKEEIAAALAPVFAEKMADATAEKLETDLELPEAVATGVANAVEDAVKKGLAYVWPVADAHFRISSPYGPRKHPVTGKQDFHAGIDIPAPQGTRVIAVAAGEVTGVGTHPNLGRYVKITHDDGTYSLYGHLQRWTTRMGRKVKAGDDIGRVGSTGRSTGPHLDFSIRRDGKPFNPMQVLADILDEKKLAFAQ